MINTTSLSLGPSLILLLLYINHILLILTVLKFVISLEYLLIYLVIKIKWDSSHFNFRTSLTTLIVIKEFQRNGLVPHEFSFGKT